MLVLLLVLVAVVELPVLVLVLVLDNGLVWQLANFMNNIST